MGGKRQCIVRDGVLKKYTGPGGHFVIPRGVTAIGFAAFKDCRMLTGVTIPKSVTEIGVSAFSGCEGLQEIAIPDSITKIWAGAFYCCKGLKEVTIPASVTEMGEEIFGHCSCDVTILGRARRLDRVLLSWNGNCLRTEDPPSALPPSCRLPAVLAFVSEPEGRSSPERTKAYENFIRRRAGDLVKTAFARSELLEYLCAHGMIGAKDIDAFLAEAEAHGTPEQKAMLLERLGHIGLKRANAVRARREKVREEYEAGLAGRNAARDPGKGIAGMTFVLGNKPPKEFGSYRQIRAYLESYGAALARSVTLQTDLLVTNFPDAGTEKCRRARLYGVPVVSMAAFGEIAGLSFPKDVRLYTIPLWLRHIAKDAFYFGSLESAAIPEGVTSVGFRSFAYCRSLKDVSFPSSLRYIGKCSFMECVSLREITVPDSVTDVDWEVFAYCRALEHVTLPKGLTRIAGGLFLMCPALKDLSIPAGVTVIEGDAFSHCTALTELILPDGLTAIGYHAFSHCSALRELVIPESVTKISFRAFEYCEFLERITLPKGLTCIDMELFLRCSSLREISIPERVVSIGPGAFQECTALRELTIPSCVSSIGERAFQGCPDLTVRVKAGSYAERYMKENRIPFIAE